MHPSAVNPTTKAAKRCDHSMINIVLNSAMSFGWRPRFTTPTLLFSCFSMSRAWSSQNSSLASIQACSLSGGSSDPSFFGQPGRLNPDPVRRTNPPTATRRRRRKNRAVNHDVTVARPVDACVLFMGARECGNRYSNGSKRTKQPPLMHQQHRFDGRKLIRAQFRINPTNRFGTEKTL